MDKIKWGVLGTASIARGCTIPGMQMAEDCELTAIAGRSLEKALAFQKEFGFLKAYGSYEELLADPQIQAVYIPLPNNLHYEWCLKAIRAGKHVLCEKPLTPTKAQAEELFAAAKEAGVLLMEAFAYLHSPYVASLQAEVEKKTIGDIKYIESAFMVQSCKDNDIRMFRENYGGAFYDLGCYCLSLMIRLLGTAPVSAQALAEFSERHIDLFSTAYLTFPGGVRASINAGMIFGNERNSRMDRLYIHGTKGSILSAVEFNQSGDLSYTVCVDGKQEVKTVHAKQNYCLEVEQLCRCIRKKEAPLVDADFSVQNAGALEMICKAFGYFD